VECRTPHTFVLAKCENISETGMLVKVRQTFEVSQPVTVRFMLPPGAAIQSGGAIVQAQVGQYMALQFVRLQSTLRDAICQYVERGASEVGVPTAWRDF
jgi:hypothetical protein